MDSTPVTIRACDASTHLPPRSRMTRPSACKASSRFSSGFLVPPGQIKETDQIVEAHWMTDFAHQPQHLLSVQPAGGRSRTSVRRPCGERSFYRAGRAGSALADGIAKVPALAGMFFHRKTFLDVERKGERNRGGGGSPLLEKGFFLPSPAPDPLHLLRLLEAGVRPGHDARPDRPGDSLQDDGFGTGKEA